jgi:aspartate carbamoyltransferase catalytic subunit
MSPTATPARRQLHPPPVPASPFPYHPGSLLSAQDLTLDGLSHLLTRATALEMKTRWCGAAFWPSAAWRCSSTSPPRAPAPALSWPPRGWAPTPRWFPASARASKRARALKDTGLTLRALGAETIILRHNSSGAAWLLEAETRLPVLNAGDGMHEHPTQALLDLRTILAHLRPGVQAVSAETLAGVTVAIAGDILHSRVARSNMLLLPRLGARVLLCGPKELLPELAAAAGPGIAIERDFEAAMRQSQAVMMLRIQAERLAGLQLDLDEYKANYQLTGRGWPRTRRKQS